MTSTLNPRAAEKTSNPEQTRVLVIIGSTRRDRFGPVPARWAAEQARLRGDIDLDVADLAAPALPALGTGKESDRLPTEVAELGARIYAADAVVIVTPVYNRGYPASVKNAIDWFHDEWAATPVGFISYGGRTGGVEAVEQLRTILVELRTMTIRNVLSFPNFWEHFDDDGRPRFPEAMTGAATAFYDQLLWWARALRTAKRSEPAGAS